MSEAQTTTTLSPGARIGAWRILRLIASGGMGEVYEAENAISSSRRALKVIRASLLGDDDLRIRFVRETTIASQIKHPNVVEAWDPLIEGDLIVLPMELLEGETLYARLRRGPLAIEEVLRIGLAVAAGIGAFHRLGIIHRDLKPGNVFLTKEGSQVKVLDFGAAREMQGQRHTITGHLIGSPSYMPPEQALGVRDLDARVDVYGLGVLLYMMTTGRRPFETDAEGNALSKLVSRAPYPPPEQLRPISPALADAIRGALMWERDARFASIQELERALQCACEAPLEAASAIGTQAILKEASAEGEATLVSQAPVHATASRTWLLLLPLLALLLLLSAGTAFVAHSFSREASTPVPRPALADAGVSLEDAALANVVVIEADAGADAGLSTDAPPVIEHTHREHRTTRELRVPSSPLRPHRAEAAPASDDSDEGLWIP